MYDYYMVCLPIHSQGGGGDCVVHFTLGDISRMMFPLIPLIIIVEVVGFLSLLGEIREEQQKEEV